MIKSTTITETHHTSGGSVQAEIRVTVSGPNDGVAKVDRALIEHVKAQRKGLDDPTERITDEGSVMVIAPENQL